MADAFKWNLAAEFMPNLFQEIMKSTVCIMRQQKLKRTTAALHCTFAVTGSIRTIWFVMLHIPFTSEIGIQNRDFHPFDLVIIRKSALGLDN